MGAQCPVFMLRPASVGTRPFMLRPASVGTRPFMLRPASVVFLCLLCRGGRATESSVTINLKVLDQGTGSTVDKFSIRQGEIVEDAIANFTSANNLYDHHKGELLDAVRGVSLVYGGGLLPLPTLILARTSASPFSPAHTNALGGLSTVLLEEAGPLATGRPDDVLAPSLFQVLYNQSLSSGTVPSNRVYALAGPDARFRPGVTPEEVFLEYERQRFLHTGSFSGQFILVMGCGTAHAAEVILFGSSLLWDLEMPWEVPSASIVQALLSSPAMYHSGALSRRLLACDHWIPVPPEELDVLVVVLTQGKGDPTTWGVFRDVAALLHEGLVGVGLRAALVQCGELRSCGLPMVGPQWVLLAPHLLAYYLNPDDTPAVLTRRDLVPDNTVLYNFEHVPLPEKLRSVDVGGGGPGDTPPSTRGRSLVGADVLSVYQRFHVWDYSRANVARLSLHNVSVSYVPVGFGESLYIPRPSGRDRPFEKRQLHVLFYGSVIPRRQKIINQLRAAGVKVAFVTAANNGTFGEELDAYLLDTRVVLSLGAFDDDAEWKMTRFLKPLANRRLIIAEDSSAEEQAHFEGGIVFVPPSEIVSACQYYLSHPEEAEQVAEEGHRLFSQMREVDILKGLPLVESLLKAQQQTGEVECI